MSSNPHQMIKEQIQSEGYCDPQVTKVSTIEDSGTQGRELADGRTYSHMFPSPFPDVVLNSCQTELSCSLMVHRFHLLACMLAARQNICTGPLLILFLRRHPVQLYTLLR